ncbi:MAG: hypothetical protein AAGE52_11510 [Myxococcota bacterium]
MNPFERWDLDPFEGPAAITERMRDLAEDADDETRALLREDWEALTMHPRRRLELAFGAHPETRAPLGRPPRPARRARPSAELTLADLARAPSVAAALGPVIDPAKLPDVPLHADPILHPSGKENRQ